MTDTLTPAELAKQLVDIIAKDGENSNYLLSDSDVDALEQAAAALKALAAKNERLREALETAKRGYELLGGSMINGVDPKVRAAEIDTALAPQAASVRPVT